MPPTHSTIAPKAVHDLAKHFMHGLLNPCRGYRVIDGPTLVRILLLMACVRSSLFDVARRLRLRCSPESARKALISCLPTLDELTERINAALNALPNNRMRRRKRFLLAIDTHYQPFYGKKGTEGVVGGPKKGGTKSHFLYATAVLVTRGQRYTLAMIPITRSTPTGQVVQRLLDLIEGHGWRIKGVTFDSAFEGGDIIDLCRKRGLGYVVPLRRKGPKSRREAWFAVPAGTVQTLDWEVERLKIRVETQAVLIVRRGSSKRELLAYGGWSWGEGRSAWEDAHAGEMALRNYRRRFGIETSYRQKNQALGWTTSTDVVRRLLLVGVALLVRQAWVYLSGIVGRDRGLKPSRWVGELPLVWLLEALGERLWGRSRRPLEIALSQPMAPLP